MSFNLSINFESYEQLKCFIDEFDKFKRMQDKKLLKKDDELATNTFIEVKEICGAHQLEYHNKAKIYQSEHPELSYKECLRIVYKNNKNDEKII